MKQNTLRLGVIAFLYLIIFVVIAFAFPFTKTGLFWLSFVLGILALLFFVYVIYKSFFVGQGAKSKLYGFPLARIGIIYLIVQFVLSLSGMILAGSAPIWIFVVADIVVLALAMSGIVLPDSIRDEIVRQDEKRVTSTNKMQELCAQALALEHSATDKNLKDKLKNLAEKLRYSDPVSCIETQEYENQIAENLEKLEEMISGENIEKCLALCEETDKLLQKRNSICRGNKKFSK